MCVCLCVCVCQFLRQCVCACAPHHGLGVIPGHNLRGFATHNMHRRTSANERKRNVSRPANYHADGAILPAGVAFQEPGQEHRKTAVVWQGAGAGTLHVVAIAVVVVAVVTLHTVPKQTQATAVRCGISGVFGGWVDSGAVDRIYGCGRCVRVCGGWDS